MSEQGFTKLPPHSIEAEQAVLGGLMISTTAFEKVGDKLIAENFYRKDHQLIYNAIFRLSDGGQPSDAVTVAEWLERNDQLEEAGSLQYIAQLANDTASAANIATYAEIVKDKSLLRSMIEVGGDITESAYKPEGQSTNDLLDVAQQKVFSLSEANSKGKQGFQAMPDVLTKTVERIEQLYKDKAPVTGLSTGLVDLDKQTAGLHPGDMVIVAGRPSMGKTSFAMNLAEHAAIAEKKSVAVFSMEMPAEQLVMRMISSNARVDQSALRTGQIRDEDWPRISSAVTLLNDSKLFIDDSGGLSPTEVRARSRRLKREHGLDLIVLDYLQLMQVPGNNEGRTSEISEISRSLKGLAKELEVPIIALSQLNRSLEKRDNKRPINSDLRESGGIEQDADVIIFIYREEVYKENTENAGIAEIIIGKQRNGPIGTVRTAFKHQFTRFENLAHEDQVYMGE